MRRRFSVSLTLVALLGALAIPAIGTASSSPASVNVGDFFFKPKNLKIQHNTKVKFHWVGTFTHNVTAIKVPKGAKKFHSPDKTTGSYSHLFTTKGTYTLMCTIHGFTMTVKVS